MSADQQLYNGVPKSSDQILKKDRRRRELEQAKKVLENRKRTKQLVKNLLNAGNVEFTNEQLSFVNIQLDNLRVNQQLLSLSLERLSIPALTTVLVAEVKAPTTAQTTDKTSFAGTVFGQSLGLLSNSKKSATANLSISPTKISVENLEEILEDEEIPTWEKWANRATSFGGLVLRTGTGLAVGAALGTVLGPIGGAILAPVATRGVLNASYALKTAAVGIIMDKTGINLTKNQKKRQRKSKNVKSKEKRQRTEKRAQSRLAKFVTGNAPTAIGSTVANAAASAIATAALFGTMNGTMLGDFSNFGISAAKSYLSGDYSHILSGVKDLATSTTAQTKALQYVTSKIGWDTIGGKMGKMIHSMIKENGTLGKSVLTESQKDLISQYIYDNPEWLNTTWADIVAGVAKDSIDAANMYAAKRVGSATVQGVQSAYEVYGDKGTEGVFDLVNESYNETYNKTAQSLADASQAVSDTVGGVVQGVTSVVGAMNSGIKTGFETYFGPTKTVEQQPEKLEQQPAKLEQLDQQLEKQKLEQQQQVEQARTDAKKRFEERLERRKQREDSANKEIDENFQKTLESNYEILNDKKAMMEMALEFAKTEGGGLAAAAILSQGIKFDALGPQFIKFAVGKLNLKSQIVANTGLGMVENQDVNDYVADKLIQQSENGNIQSETDFTRVLAEVSKEVFQATSAALNVGQVVGLKYDLARIGLVMGANAVELAGFAYDNQNVQEYAQVSRGYLSMLPTSGAIKDCFLGSLGVESETPQVDLGQVVTQAVFEKYLNPFSGKTNAQVAANAVDSVLWGQGEANQLRVTAKESITSILDAIEKRM